MRVSKPGSTAQPSHLKIGVAGLSGVGKTSLGANAWITDPKAVIIGATEAQAEAIIRLHNPDATVVILDSFADVQLFWELLYSGFRTGIMHEPVVGTDPNTGKQTTTLRATKDHFLCETVVLDSFSDIFRMVKHEITMRDHARSLKKYISNKGSADGFDDPEVTSMQAWGIIQDKCINILRAFRNLPAHLLALYGVDEREESGRTVYRPFLQGRDLKSATVGFFNAYGYQYMAVDGDGEVQRAVAFRTGDQFTTKGLDGLANHEAPDFKLWASKFEAYRAKAAKRMAADRKTASTAGTTKQKTKKEN